MPIDLRPYASFAALLYTDRMDVTSAEEEEADDSSTLNVYPKEPQQKDIPCKVALPQKDKVDPDSLHEAIELNPVIFCDPAVQIKAGDRITIRKCFADGTVYETFEGLLAETGKPNVFTTHQEFELQVKGDA